MPKAVRTSKAKTVLASEAPRVAVVGGGLAGLTAAYELAKRGFKVTLYEAKQILGGNFSSEEINGVYHDVYPHMFCEWYSNFWQLFSELAGHSPSVAQKEHFESRGGVKLLHKGSSTYVELENATKLSSVWANLTSGILSLPDMFLLGFSMLDLAATPFQRSGDDLLERLDVNGFVYSRGYSTEKVAMMQNYILMVIWSIQSDITAAASYQDFVKHSMLFPRGTPFSYLLKGSLQEKIIVPFEQKLKETHCDIQRGARVQSVELIDGKPRITLETTTGIGQTRESVEFADYLVLAVPSDELARLVMTGRTGNRVVERVPQLSEVRRCWGEPIPVVDIYFNKKLPNLPKEQVGLLGSDSDLTVLDISQLWTKDPNMKGRTALVLAASNGYALTSEDPAEQGFQMIRRLHDYIPDFKPGAFWGDPASDICWEKTHFRDNNANKLFVNDVGSWQWRPVASYASLANVYFAGDFCRTDVDMATIEAAVQSGLLASQALQAQARSDEGARRGDLITVAKHEVYSDAHLLAAKLALLPLAYAACAWSAAVDTSSSGNRDVANAYSPTTYSLLLPLAFTLDWWKTAYWLARKSLPGAESSDQVKAWEGGVAPSDAPISLGSHLASAAGEFFHHLAAPANAAAPSMSAALGNFLGQTWRAAQAAYTVGQIAAPNKGAHGENHRRGRRVKS